MTQPERTWGICPKCKKPTKITSAGPSTRTLVYYQLIYDKYGNNTNPDKNITTFTYKCLECETIFSEKN